MLDRSIASDDAGAVTRAGQALRGYVLHELLGEGAASQVYRGTQPGIGRDVAIKQLPRDFGRPLTSLSDFCDPVPE